MKIERLNSEHLKAGQEFYSSKGYSAKIGPNDLVLMAREKQRIIGLVRISREEDEEILRGMFVDEHYQRQGIGKMMLRELEKHFENEEAYCLPYEHLENLYACIGFERIEERAAPLFLQHRLRGYHESGLHCMIMKRSRASNN